MALHDARGWVDAHMSFIAVWTVTVAFSTSTICHIPIVAKCCGIADTQELLFPLGGLMFVYFAWLSSPVLGMALAIGIHVGQIVWNIRLVRRMKSLLRPSQ
jgi:hypothetical protein